VRLCYRQVVFMQSPEMNYLTLYITIISSSLLLIPAGGDNTLITSQYQQEPSDHQTYLFNIAKHNKMAHTIWNFINKHKLFNPDNIDLYCYAELKHNHRLIAPILINNSLEDSQTYLKVSSIEHREKYIATSLDAKLIVQHMYNIMRDQQLYYNTVRAVLQEMYNTTQGLMCPQSSNCGCISMDILEKYKYQLSDFSKSNNDIWEYIIFKEYIEPCFRIPICVFGLILNIILLLILTLQKSMKIETNLLILNLAVSNIVTLLIYTPVQYGQLYGIHYAVEIYNSIDLEVLVVTANAMIMLCLNIKRYFDVSRVLKPEVSGCRMNSTVRCIVYSLVIWTTSIMVAFTIPPRHQLLSTIIKTFLYSFMYLVTFSILVAVFSMMSARKLQRAALQEQTNPELENVISSSVVLGVTVVYYAVHIPFLLVCWLDVFVSARTHFLHPTYRILTFIIHTYFLTYPLITVAVLYKASSAFRTYFRKYICRCWYIPDDGEYITMSSLQHAENQD
ncbi:hypothetical protein L9F63_021615, partial [Diploptera punctata]